MNNDANVIGLKFLRLGMLALAAAHPRTKPFVPKYVTAIIQRADEIRQVFGAYRDLFMATPEDERAAGTGTGRKARAHRGSLPRAVWRGVGECRCLHGGPCRSHAHA